LSTPCGYYAHLSELGKKSNSSAQFKQGRIAGRKEERNRIKAYHEEVFSSMIAALFLIETAKSELKEAGLLQAETVSKASDILTVTTRGNTRRTQQCGREFTIKPKPRW
jgi:hypothetical protein